MLRVAIVRGVRCAGQGIARGQRGQWQTQRIQVPLNRAFADLRTTDKTIFPGSESKTVAEVPQAPILDAPTPIISDIPELAKLKTDPTPVVSTLPIPAPSTITGNIPPTGTGTAATGPTSAPPPSPPPPKRPRRRFRTFLLSLFILSSLGYAGGVYYSLVSDNFHDFFTEYIPYGEDSVAYFEEREYRKRFPTREYGVKNWPQTRGENKVTIGKSSGLTPRIAEEHKESSDSGPKGRHVSALEDNNKPQPGKAQQTPDAASPREKTQAVEAAKKGVEASQAASQGKSGGQTLQPKDNVPNKGGVSSSSTSQPKEAASRPAQDLPQVTADAKPAAPPAPMIDHLSVPRATEPVVQDLVKMVNNVITAINASPEASKFSSTVQTAKGDLNNIISTIGTLKDSAAHEAETKIKDAHTEFDTAAKELVRRLEQEMREQESKWREEYENEREKLSNSYQQRLQTELDSVKKVQDEERKNALIQQEIDLQKQYMDSVKSKVEAERSGRLSKIDALAQSLEELETLTGDWSSVLDATLQTQHLQVAVEAVRSKVLDSDTPTPFLDELVALKAISQNDAVVNAAIASINPLAYQRGIPSPAALIDRFRRVASEVRKASLLPEDAGMASHAASAVLSRFMFAKKADRGLPEGEDVEATLARAEVLLEEGDLDAAAREMNGLRGWTGVLSRDWVGECRRVLEVRQAVEVIAAEARLQSLLVE
ncbi:MICOS complex subunit mic60 [Friedmanniomyces endolithicus]|uniref:MICOS complex subunit MIC60 n=1 Tax=Friedmanniomyces endolithicus TaxID=329885 RepID=A0AAN6J5A7_9PEZI|nr:MICOS complex subunit mic60 [Friedmanniomyces endolithicus]KAK0316076.1 MICOS complex subunit mic60 [Friedmanniomyces endolithicus]KAK0985610.1 MICOS complex subunit mic60 [Friedmanniomyces endolithicus]